MTISRKVSNGINIVAAVVALYAAMFFWTRGWVGFSPKAIPWLAYTLMPYIAFWFMSKKLQKEGATKGRNLLFVVTSLIMLAITAYTYLQFTNEHMIFYLRQFLFLIPIVCILGLLLLIGVGSLLTKSSSRDAASGAP